MLVMRGVAVMVERWSFTTTAEGAGSALVGFGFGFTLAGCLDFEGSFCVEFGFLGLR